MTQTRHDPASVTLSLSRIREWVGGRQEGGGDPVLTGVASLETATSDQLALVAEAKYLEAASTSSAGAFLVAEELSAALADAVGPDRPRIVVESPREAVLPLLQHLDPTPRYEPGVHPTAVLGRGVRLADGVSVGPYAVLEDGAVIGEGTRVGAHCVVGRDAVLGEECYLHPQVVIYAGSRVGDRVVLQAGARVGSDGFGFVAVDGRYRKVPQVGGCILEDDTELGANTCVDRGSTGDTVVGAGSKLDNLVHLAHNVRLGENCGLAALVGIAGSTSVGDWAMMGGQAGAIGHLTLGKGIQVSAQAGIIGDLEDGARVTGFPARDQREQMKSWAAAARVPDALKRLRALEAEVEALRAALDASDS